MSTELNNNSSQEAPQWMRDMFEALTNMFEGFFPDEDTLNFEEMQRRLDEQAQSEKTANNSGASCGVQKIMGYSKLVVSTVWVLAGGLWGNKIALDEAGRLTRVQLNACAAENKVRYGEHGPYDQVWSPCWGQSQANFRRNAEGHWRFAALCACSLADCLAPRLRASLICALDARWVYTSAQLDGLSVTPHLLCRALASSQVVIDGRERPLGS